MVVLSEWHRTVMDQKSRSCLPLTGEDTGLGALASPLAGYLGKVQERAASLEFCPWCTSKGLTFALRSYHVNLQESITLCTNPQCLFPLVSRPMEDVLASLHPADTTVGRKRQNPLTLEKEEPIRPAHKRLRSQEPDEPQCTDTDVSQAEHDAVNTVSNGQTAAPRTEGGKVNGYHGDSPVGGQKDVPECGFASPISSAAAGHSHPSTLTAEPAPSPLSVSEEDDRQTKSPPDAQSERSSLDSTTTLPTKGDTHSHVIEAPPPQRTEQTGQKSPAADISTCNYTHGFKSQIEDLPSIAMTPPEELVPIQSRLFWRNSSNLCWLDSLLVALVNFKSLRKCKPKDEPERSSVWRLMEEYEDICAAVRVHQQLGSDGVARVPNGALQKANAELETLRMSVFTLIQPKLRCKLGHRETPVFALPLLLSTDSWVEPLLQTSFHWDFKCSECKAAMTDRVVKTLPTFTKILPNWHPLRAIHFAPCNVCCKKNQTRTMMLERVPPVFGLHFVEGLPDNDVRTYTFAFQGRRFSITTVIQYNQQLKHFVTWICNSDGLWLEYDDMKHPHCEVHQKLLVPAQEMHIVFWEMEEDKEPQACSPSSTFTEPPPSAHEPNPSRDDKDRAADEPPACAPDPFLLAFREDADVISSNMDTTGVDTSIGSTTLLDAFEGLSHNDIITLTLVELKVDLETQPVSDDRQTQDPVVPVKTGVLDSTTPDRSSAVVASEMSQSLAVEIPASPDSPGSAGDSSSDPTFVPARARRGRGRGTGRGRTASRQKGKKASKAAPAATPSEAVAVKPAQDNAPPVETTQQASPESSTRTSPVSTTPSTPPSLHQNARWSFLLSKYPLHQDPAVKIAPTPVAQVKPTLPTHSTPNPVRRQQNPGRHFPKPQLKTEGGEDHPLKPAEMYGAFGMKSSNSPSSFPPPAFLNSRLKELPPVIHNQKVLTNTAVVSEASLPAPAAKALADITPAKKHSHSSKVPPGLSTTDALRYKLLKKLKAKKKKLCALNGLLGQEGGAGVRPGSSNAVTSSTYDGSTCSDDFLMDLLSPATTASNLSPDSTGFLEMLANGQDGSDLPGCGDGAVGAPSQAGTCANEPNGENFLEDFLSQTMTQRQTEMETEALSALEYFV